MLAVIIIKKDLVSKCHFGSAVSLCGRGGGKITSPPLVFSRITCPIHFKLNKYLNHHKYFQNKSKWYSKSRGF